MCYKGWEIVAYHDGLNHRWQGTRNGHRIVDGSWPMLKNTIDFTEWLVARGVCVRG